MEIKTNFGYGSASYFYTKLKYKDIEITPFSDWIKYRFAKFSEIIRYSQWHNLENSEWLEAMNYAAEACNLSRDDENKFIEKYIIDECEEMVSELENILNKEEFEFRDQSKRTYTKNIKGHELIEFRGEKISGALDFINKILEYEHIVAVKTFIERIKACNKIIQPILANELLVIDIKLKKLLADAEELKPNYLVVVEKYNQYMTEKSKMQNQMIIDKEIDFKNIDVLKVKRAFLSKFPEYEVFEIEYKKIVSTYTTLLEQIENLKIVFENITTYNKNILLYFN
ncbi:MAG: hypothetical protein IPL10_12365 [Bacteroidetes bacterium]|nr:hypothetical protein [Bacteroidota bacterium]